MTIELTPEELSLLTFALGIAAGSVQEEMRSGLLQLANTLHKDDPNWTPYR